MSWLPDMTIKKLALEPGDFVIAYLEEDVSAAQLDEIRNGLIEELGTDRVLLLKGLRLGVLKQL